MIERWDYIDFRIVSFLSRARKRDLHYPRGAWKHRLDVLTLWKASKVRCDLSMRHQLCLIRSNGDMVQDWPCTALNPPYDIPKISKILELRESMQCEDKDPTLDHLALARRGCWIIYKILIRIPDCHQSRVSHTGRTAPANSHHHRLEAKTNGFRTVFFRLRMGKQNPLAFLGTRRFQVHFSNFRVAMRGPDFRRFCFSQSYLSHDPAALQLGSSQAVWAMSERLNLFDDSFNSSMKVHSFSAIVWISHGWIYSRNSYHFFSSHNNNKFQQWDRQKPALWWDY